MSKTRLEAFSDGVIAIIITIMVLEMKVPHSADWSALISLWPVFLSYLVSFLMLGIYWGNHHHLIHTSKKVTGSVMWANLHLLFWLSLIPFATGWMGENQFEPKTIAVYAFLLNLCGFAYYILLITIKKCNHNDKALMEILNKQSKKGLRSVFIYLVAIPAAFLSPAIGLGLIVLNGLIWLIPDRNIENAVKND